MPRNTTHSYGSIARSLHWLTALIILANIVLGLVAVRLPMEALQTKFQLFSLHKTLGIAAFVVALLRIVWALTQPRPVPVHPERRLETFLAESMHWVLYAALVLVPLTGWIEHAATEGYAPILWPFGQGLPMVPKSPQVAEVMASIHHIFAWVLIGAIVLHVAGAMKHAVIDRDGVLARMLRGRPAGTPTDRRHLTPALTALVVFVAGTAFAIVPRPDDAQSAAPLEQAASEWQVTEGDLGFAVAQMGSQVQGGFSDWTAAIAFDPDTGLGEVEVTINMNSVTIGTVTDQAKGAEFFDVANNPVAVFRGDIRPDGDRFIAEGPLSLKGHQTTVTLPFTLEINDGIATMSGETTLDRRDWNIGQGYDNESSVGFPVSLAVRLTAHR
ncbi:Cytochrome b561 [Paracoccus alcaliphilus]|uniref:Cytochrome b561 n=1 Tax=Paracoccus alcaliphilus TaxID=34002 RepID=A0A1H8F6Q5_9RHOB|nr:cytochrome b/b6 domain-containing protein [Paracoccus alcaliphilus]WCR20364.1 cytochrome b/b6 domain-containing protein [Paracoccus alcaliphilus]SEN26738.1 Cytochrome b561 [Paracoccus alcaliphilus]